jgi:hypothetical protein
MTVRAVLGSPRSHVAGGRLVSRWAVGGCLAVGLLVGGAVSVGAVPWGHFGPGYGYPPSVPAPVVSGTVSTAPASATGSFTLVAWGGATWTVDLSTSTTYREAGVSSPTYSNVAVGDQASVAGTSTGSDTVAASSVSIAQTPVVVGTVATAPAASTGSFTVTTHGGVTWTVTLTGSTTYTECGITSPSFTDLAVGDQAVVFGSSTGTDAATATSVVIIQRPAVSGSVATAPASATGSFTLTNHGGNTWTVDLTGSTTYTEHDVTSPDFSDVAVGDDVVVFGTSTGTDTVTASSVAIMQRPVVRGTVATAPASSTGSFTVTAWKNQTVTVDLTTFTTYTERAVTSPDFSDVVVGDDVVVLGTSTGTNTVTASSVAITQRPVVQGRVATAPASATGSITVTTRNNQTWTVDLSGSTTYLEHGVSSPTYTDVAVGAEVVVYGTSAGSNTVDASSVVIMSTPHQPAAPPSPWAVASFSPSSDPALTLHLGITGTTPGSGGDNPRGSGTPPSGNHSPGGGSDPSSSGSAPSGSRDGGTSGGQPSSSRKSSFGSSSH